MIDKASPVFKEYLELKSPYVDVLEKYTSVLRTYPKYYESLLEESKIFTDSSLIRRIDEAYLKLKKEYPDAKLKPNTICIGFMDDGGKSLNSGQYIGIEYQGATKNADVSELPQYLIESFGNRKSDFQKIDRVITHELVHLSQFKPDDIEAFLKDFKGTLKYGPLLQEGGASFVTDYLYDFEFTREIIVSPETYDFCVENEAELWDDFLSSEDFPSFFYGVHPKYNKSMIGYYLGYMVCKSYYDKAVDKHQAIIDIIKVQDWDLLVEKSGYGK